ncbi:hypothetical protein Cgig2_028553 [Carnegiea gigantea]|uniref:Protein NRT1/ PTR FAMILY 6.1 n=1 Tax=Carnegiea gigantea TaxID=171969 RepID=A0A9Q1JWP1_9CARY|nr:hypothetical protein Cgig2_028553 [Carnegiea gigantea]
MDSREIKSPEVLIAGTPNPAPGLGVSGSGSNNNNNNNIFELSQRKKLGIYFIESDDRRRQLVGVILHRYSLCYERLIFTKHVGFYVFSLLAGNEMAERMAYFGLSVNMVAFMFYVMHRPFPSSANAVNNFLGISQASSDAYLGRYWTIAIFTTIYLTLFVPDQGQCDQIALLLGNCEPAKPWQMLYLYMILYITAFGAAGIRPCVSSFGADQFDERSRDYKAHLDKYFNVFYLSVTIGAIIAFTAVVYIQMQHGWGSAFGCLALGMGISNMLFFIGTPIYRHRLPGGNPFSRVAQVLAAAFRKRSASFSSSEMIGLYELPGNRSAIRGTGKIAHTDHFRYLDKAALQLMEDGPNPTAWRLCTVTQVEEVKILIKLLPIPACTIMLNLILTEFLALSVQQAYTLNTHIGHLKVPVICMPVFPALSIFLMLSLYYYLFAPVSRCITGHPHGASQLQRVGIGLAISILSVAWAGVFERFRRNYASFLVIFYSIFIKKKLSTQLLY